ncbi:MAG: hypothetical protein DU429_02855 [Candidatus Tokpelaia sp.]|nr:MAG: hypothetical protein DU430_05605 [Candidatus Tokpelaia sp.]KAA6207406.1 MAG: hypothetical protein DU429_02855 [Candidatus Tokpelaia sp.]
MRWGAACFVAAFKVAAVDGLQFWLPVRVQSILFRCRRVAAAACDVLLGRAMRRSLFCCCFQGGGG